MKHFLKYSHILFANKILAITALDYVNSKTVLKKIEDICGEFNELWGTWYSNILKEPEKFELSRLCFVISVLEDFDDKDNLTYQTKNTNIKDLIGYDNMFAFVEIVVSTAFLYMDSEVELNKIKGMLYVLLDLWGVDILTPQGNQENQLLRLVALIDTILEGVVSNQ